MKEHWQNRTNVLYGSYFILEAESLGLDLHYFAARYHQDQGLLHIYSPQSPDVIARVVKNNHNKDINDYNLPPFPTKKNYEGVTSLEKASKIVSEFVGSEDFAVFKKYTGELHKVLLELEGK